MNPRSGGRLQLLGICFLILAAGAIFYFIFNSPHGSGDADAYRGAKLFTRGDYTGAINMLEAALEKPLEDFEPDLAHILLAASYMETGEVAKGVESYRKAIEVNPDSDDAWMGMGMAFQQQGLYEDAEKCYKRGLEIAPYRGANHFLLGGMYIQTNRYPEAVRSLEKANELTPEWLEALDILAMAYSLNGDAEKAKSTNEKAEALRIAGVQTSIQKYESLLRNMQRQ